MIATSLPSGNVTSTPLRLFSRAPRTVSVLPLPFRRRLGVAMRPLAREELPGRRRLAREHVVDASPAPPPSPPWTPGPGPISTMWSAARMVSSSCSTTMTVLPMSRRLSSVAIIFTLSFGCRPMLGSSST